jgi:ethanolamine transporter EutH
VAVEQYYMAVRAYGSARLRYANAQTVPDSWQYYGEMVDAERNVNLMTVALAGSASVTVGGLLGVAALCSPSVLFPTP